MSAVQVSVNSVNAPPLGGGDKNLLANKFSGIVDERPLVSVVKVAGKLDTKSQDFGQRTFDSFQSFITSKETSTARVIKSQQEDPNDVAFSFILRGKKLDYSTEAHFSLKPQTEPEGYLGYVSVGRMSKIMDGSYDIKFFKDRLNLEVFYNAPRNGVRGNYASAVKDLVGTVIFPKVGNLDNPYFVPKDGTEKDAVALKPIMQKMVADAKARDKLPPVKRVEQPKVEKPRIQACKTSLPFGGCMDGWPKFEWPWF